MATVEVDLFGNPTLVHLVYRKSHKSESVKTSWPRVYDFRDFVSISPKRIVKYQRNIAPDTTDYTQMWLNRGATINSDGTLDKSNLIAKLTLDNRTHGLMSRKGKANVNLVIDWMVLLSKDKVSKNERFNSYFKWKINFVTLTLSSKQVHSDKEIQKKLFSPMLDYIRKKYKVTMYFWRAEAQANGNIHYHLCTDVFIPWKELKYHWNRFQNKLGYIDAFEAKNKHRTPNSTDIHSLKNVKDIGAYLSKYCGKNSKGIQLTITKKEKGIRFLSPYKLSVSWVFPPPKAKFFRSIFGKLWACSENLSKLKRTKMPCSDAISFELMTVAALYPSKIIDFDYCKYFKLGITELATHGCNELLDVVRSHVLSILKPPKTPNLLVN